MSEWKEVRLGDIAPFKYGKSKVAKERITGEYRVFSSSGHCGYSDENLANNGIIVGRKGSVGTVHYSDQPFFAIDTAFYIDEVAKDCDINFMYYYLKTLKLEEYNNDAAVPGLNRNLAHGLRISVPNLAFQEKIANVLSIYDKLIENNNRRIEVLEQTAEEIYKEWFVRMRFPGYENTKFVKGIPEGWEVKKLNEIFDVSDGTHDTPKEEIDGFPLVTGRNIINGQIDFSTTYNISEENYKKINVRSAINKNDILYSNIGTIGQMTIVQDNNKYSVKNLIILKTSVYQFHEYIYLHFKNDACQSFFNSVASGASQKFISLTEMRKYKLLVPGEEILELFKLKTSNLLIQIENLNKQNLNLAKQRDLLLPRLMNGTIEVK